jgi:hypothetical protein
MANPSLILSAKADISLLKQGNKTLSQKRNHSVILTSFESALPPRLKVRALSVLGRLTIM